MHKRFSIALSVAVLGCATPGTTPLARAAAPESAAPAVPRTDRLTAETIVDLRWVSSVAISPDGKRVAYVVRTPPDPLEGPKGSRSIVWVVASKGGEPRRFTPPTASSSQPHWSPDGRKLAYLSNREGDDHSQIYVVPADGGEAVVLTESKSSISLFAWAPDGKAIAYVAKALPTPEEKKASEEGRDWKLGDVSGTRAQLWIASADTGEAKALDHGTLHVSGFDWAPDGTALAFKASERADVDAEMMYSRVYTIATIGGTAEPLTETAGKLGEIAWSPDGKQIAFLGAADIHDPTGGVLYVAPAKGGPARALTAAYEGTGQWIEWAGNGTVVMLANEGTRTPIYEVSLDGKLRRAVDGPICHAVDLATKTAAIACAGDTPTHPTEVFVGKLGQRVRRVTNTNPQLDGVLLGAREIVRWKAADGLEIEGVLTKPVDYREGQRYPLAILVHGGPEGVSLDGFNTRGGYPVQLFATHGYVVLEPNYRGSQGRGVAFGKADQRDLGGREFEDVLAGIDHLAAQGLVDPQRVGMGGWSYGGYFSALAATRHTGRFKAAMVGAAITNWISFTGTTEIEHENSLVHWDLWPWDEMELVWQRSPMAHAKGSKTATLLVHGAADTRVPPEQAFELYRALRRAGTTTELVTYPREGHGLGERMHQIDFAQRFVDWFDTHVKG